MKVLVHRPAAPGAEIGGRFLVHGPGFLFQNSLPSPSGGAAQHLPNAGQFLHAPKRAACHPIAVAVMEYHRGRVSVRLS